MITITVALIPFVVVCAIFLVSFFAVCFENDGTSLFSFVILALSIGVYFAVYGFFTAIGLL